MSRACAQFGISRKTGYKWLRRFQAQPTGPLLEQSRRPKRSPARAGDKQEQRVLEVRRQYGWGARKIHAYLTARGVALPSLRTVHQILVRHGTVSAAAERLQAPQFFERTEPNQLWQCDHKGALEIARQKVYPLTILDDHSRYLFPLRACLDVTMRTAFDVLWDVFGEFGLPESLLCDNAFGTNFRVPKTPSWFDAQLIRLGIRPVHGRPYHPQTQGKVERLHGTFEREIWPQARRDTVAHFEQDVNRWRREVYNLVRPHESLGDQPPLTRFRPSSRLRPQRVPDVSYDAGAVLRKVSGAGEIYWNGYRILAGTGLTGQFVRIEDRGHEVAVFYAWKEIRTLATKEMHRQNQL
jgi:transposase InsO family protein